MRSREAVLAATRTSCRCPSLPDACGRRCRVEGEGGRPGRAPLRGQRSGPRMGPGDPFSPHHDLDRVRHSSHWRGGDAAADSLEHESTRSSAILNPCTGSCSSSTGNSGRSICTVRVAASMSMPRHACSSMNTRAGRPRLRQARHRIADRRLAGPAAQSRNTARAGAISKCVAAANISLSSMRGGSPIAIVRHARARTAPCRAARSSRCDTTSD